MQLKVFIHADWLPESSFLFHNTVYSYRKAIQDLFHIYFSKDVLTPIVDYIYRYYVMFRSGLRSFIIYDRGTIWDTESFNLLDNLR